MNIEEQINNQFNYYMRGLLTYSEAMESIIKIAYGELPRIIEVRKGNKGKWKDFSDKQYTAEEAADILETLNYNSMGYEFRVKVLRTTI